MNAGRSEKDASKFSSKHRSAWPPKQTSFRSLSCSESVTSWPKYLSRGTSVVLFQASVTTILSVIILKFLTLSGPRPISLRSYVNLTPTVRISTSVCSMKSPVKWWARCPIGTHLTMRVNNRKAKQEIRTNWITNFCQSKKSQSMTSLQISE